jgi:peroxiredoxin (alkyl hydroperoxide reductase subunit C)
MLYCKGTAAVNGEFKELSLEDFKGKYLVLFFYPLDFTFVCPTENVAFSDKVNEFHDVNCEVVAISVDSHFSHLAWIDTPRKNDSLGHVNIHSCQI